MLPGFVVFVFFVQKPDHLFKAPFLLCLCASSPYISDQQVTQQVVFLSRSLFISSLEHFVIEVGATKQKRILNSIVFLDHVDIEK